MRLQAGVGCGDRPEQPRRRRALRSDQSKECLLLPIALRIPCDAAPCAGHATGEKISVPAISKPISSDSVLIGPCVTRYAPNARASAAPSANAPIGNAARQYAYREHPESTVGLNARRLHLDGLRPLRSDLLAKRLERRQALHRVEKLFSMALNACCRAIVARRFCRCTSDGQYQCRTGAGEHDTRSRQIPPRHKERQRRWRMARRRKLSSCGSAIRGRKKKACHAVARRRPPSTASCRRCTRRRTSSAPGRRSCRRDVRRVSCTRALRCASVVRACSSMARRMIATAATPAIGSSSSRCDAWRNTNASNMPRKAKRAMPVNRAAIQSGGENDASAQARGHAPEPEGQKCIACGPCAPDSVCARGLGRCAGSGYGNRCRQKNKRLRPSVFGVGGRIRIRFDEHEAPFIGQPEVEPRIVAQFQRAKRFSRRNQRTCFSTRGGNCASR